MTSPLPPHILDASALVALFAAVPRVYDLLGDADAGRTTVAIPTCCIAEAQGALRSATGWAAIFDPGRVDSVPLDESAALEIGMWSGGFGCRHAVWEARQMDGTVVTCRPGDYAGFDVPLLVV